MAMTCAFALRGVSSSQKLLLIALANYADENMRCYPSHKRLAADTCLTDRTIRGLLASLEAMGLVSRKERVRPDGSRSSDLVTLHLDRENVVEKEGAQISGGTEMVSGGVRKQFPGGTEMVSGLTTYEPVIEPNEEPKGSSKTTQERGTRLPDGWLPGWAYAVSDFGLSDEEHSDELEKFRDYWRGVPGGSGRKSDWNATWRNWMRRASNDLARRKPNARNHQQDRKQAAYLERLSDIDRAMAEACG